jgi:hypothetical protein
MKNAIRRAGLLRALPIATSAAIIGMMVACGQGNNGGSAKVTVGPPGNVKSETEKTIATLLEGKYDCSKPENIALAKRLEGASLISRPSADAASSIDLTSTPVNTVATTTADVSTTTAPEKTFDAKIGILLKGETSDQDPALVIAAAGTTLFSPPDATSRVTAAEKDQAILKRKNDFVHSFLTVDSKQSSAGVDQQFKVQIKCKDAACLTAVVQLLQVGDPSDSTTNTTIRARAVIVFQKKGTDYAITASPGADAKKCVMDGKISTFQAALNARKEKGLAVSPVGEAQPAVIVPAASSSQPAPQSDQQSDQQVKPDEAPKSATPSAASAPGAAAPVASPDDKSGGDGNALAQTAEPAPTSQK